MERVVRYTLQMLSFILLFIGIVGADDSADLDPRNEDAKRASNFMQPSGTGLGGDASSELSHWNSIWKRNFGYQSNDGSFGQAIPAMVNWKSLWHKRGSFGDPQIKGFGKYSGNGIGGFIDWHSLLSKRGQAENSAADADTQLFDTFNNLRAGWEKTPPELKKKIVSAFERIMAKPRGPSKRGSGSLSTRTFDLGHSAGDDVLQNWRAFFGMQGRK